MKSSYKIGENERYRLLLGVSTYAILDSKDKFYTKTLSIRKILLMFINFYLF